MEEETRYFYQPDLTRTLICWSWTFIVFIIGLVVWLEITHFQWITATFFVIFLALVVLEVKRRTVLMTPSKLVFSRLLQKDYMVIPLADIRQPHFTKHTVTMTVNGEVLNFTFTNKGIRRLQTLIDLQGKVAE
ncbi:MAG: EbsA family protein [Limosilactobacillus sp.]|uniref:EbsA family protein n=1 Tax=Limosilactobacillus sp. TaxID=2773925 RepID=UPI002705521C|nr:EbsA family protein [Limosilactobacillus sp.]